MINIYWPVFKNIERQFVELMFDIHIDDNQLGVYSLKISDLILRTAVEIESISKDLYLLNNGSKTQQIKYDEDAIKHLNQLWLLDKKVVIISSPNCFLSKRLIYPFAKNDKRTGTQRLTYHWNNSYQNLKHDRAKSLHFANVKCLFEIMAALFILNIYFRDEKFNLGTSNRAINFPTNLGSKIFSIELHDSCHYFNNQYLKNDNFDNCTYVIKMTEKSANEHNRIEFEREIRINALLRQHPKFLKLKEKKNDDDDDEFSNVNMYKLLGQDEYLKVYNLSQSVDLSSVWEKTEYQVILNKNLV